MSGWSSDRPRRSRTLWTALTLAALLVTTALPALAAPSGGAPDLGGSFGPPPVPVRLELMADQAVAGATVPLVLIYSIPAGTHLTDAFFTVTFSSEPPLDIEPPRYPAGEPVDDGQVYRGEGMTFRVGPVPSTWRRVEVDQSLVAFRDDDAEATIAVNGRCGQDGDDVPLTALTAHLFLHFTERRLLEQQLIPMDGREALRTELIAKLDGVPKHFTVVVLKKDGCVYDFLHITDGNAPGGQEEFQRFVRGFATLS